MFGFGRKLLKVTFHDQTTRAVISAVRMPLERVPETFGAGTELKMAGGHYVVVGADPPTKQKAVDVGRLDIFVRKRELPSEAS